MVKKATFDYTDMSEVDSSFIDAVYYNSKTQELAVAMSNGSHHFYGDVPFRVYEVIVEGPSAGQAYNWEVKDVYENLANGPVHEVQYVKSEGVSETFEVVGYFPMSATYRAGSAAEAARKFAEEIAPYYGEVKIAEVNKVV